MYRLGLILCLFLVGCEPAQEADVPEAAPRAVKVTKIAAALAGVEYNYPATVLSAHKAELSFRVGGQILALPVHAMTEVKKGDLIAKIDPRDYASTVSQIKAQIAAERSRLKAMTSGSRSEDIASLRAGISASESRVVAARADAERKLTQYRKGIVPKEQIDSALAAVKTAQAQLAADKQNLSKGQSGSRKEDVTTQNAVIRTLQTQLNNARDVEDDTSLLAPFDGIVAERLVDNFANVQPKQTIAIIQDLQNLELSFNLPGPDVARFGKHRDKLKVEALLDAVPGRRFKATLVEFTSQADARTRTFETRVSIERPDDFSILPGMVGQVRIIDSSQATSSANISLPESAIGADSYGNPVVWVVNDDNAVEMRKVELGTVGTTGIAVLSGVSVGDVVVSAGLSAMIVGLKVRPINEVGN